MHGCASPTESMILKDAALRLNPAIQPIEREEKRLFDNSNPEIVKWDITTCKKINHLASNEKFKVRNGYIEKLATEKDVPYVTFNTRTDINYTKKWIISKILFSNRSFIKSKI